MWRVRFVRFVPYGIDISSGIETDGVKDDEKIKAFTNIVRTIAHCHNMALLAGMEYRKVSYMSEQRHGYFGSFGGQFMPETLMNAVIELEEAYNKYKDDPDFVRELEDLHKIYRSSIPFILCRSHDKGPWRR